MKLQHLLFSVFYTAAFLCKSYQLGDFIGIYRALFHLHCQRHHFLVACRFQRINNRKRQLSFQHIVARRLSYLGRIVVIEYVVAYLEDNSDALQLTHKYWDGVVPACGELQDVDRQAIQEFKDVKEKVESYLDVFKFREAQKEAMNLARIGNRYITECEPWKVWKTDPKRVETILNISLQLVANLSIAFEPFLPFSSKELRNMINLAEYDWTQLGSTDIIPAGHKLNAPHLLFEKIEDEAIDAQLKKLEDTKKANEAASYVAEPIKKDVSFDDFEKLDIRVGHILHCEKVKKSKKLLKFTIDDGTGTERTILSGIAAFYEPEQLIGKDVLFVANFPPRNMMGIESQGMILSAVNFDGSLSVTTTMGEVKPGSQVG